MLKVVGATAIAIFAWLAFVGYSAFAGLWMSPVVAEGDSEAFFDYAVQSLQENNRGAASLLMIEDGVIVNEFHDGPQGNINRDTVFAAASLSKWPAA